MLLGALAGFDSMARADGSLLVGSATLCGSLAEVLKRCETTLFPSHVPSASH